MKTTSKELKRQARESLTGRYGVAIGAFVVYFLISMVFAMVLTLFVREDSTTAILIMLGGEIIVSLLTSVLAVGMQFVALNISRGKEVSMSQLFFGFSNQPGTVIALTVALLLIALPCYLPGMIVFIVGVITSSTVITIVGVALFIAGTVGYLVLIYGYAMAYFIYLDDPQKGAVQILRESREMMMGNKGRYFYVGLSFIGLSILCSFTCGIGLLWLVPYMSVTEAKFYDDLKAQIPERDYYGEQSQQQNQ